MTDTQQLPNARPDRAPDAGNESRTVDKNARPAGRRFQSFTPPDLAALGRKPEDLAPIAAPVVEPLLRKKVRRRDLLVALSLAAAGGVVVAAMARVHVAERGANTSSSAASPGSAAVAVTVPVATPSAASADLLTEAAPEPSVDGPPDSVDPGLPAKKSPPDPAVPSTPAAVRSAVPVPAATSAPNNPDSDNRPPGPNPLAPVEPPF